MGHKIGDVVTGKIFKVRPFALFVKLEDNSEGLVHISELSDSYVKDIEAFGTIDDEITVKVIQVDGKNGFMRFTYKGVPEEERSTTHQDNHRHMIAADENEFIPLKEKLPEWINEVLKKQEDKK